MMNKLSLKLLALIGLAISLFFVNTNKTFAQQPSCGFGDIQNFTADPVHAVPGDTIVFQVTDAPPSSSNRILHIIIGPQNLASGHLNFLASEEISIIEVGSAGGNGTATWTVPAGFYNGNHVVEIVDLISSSNYTVCSRVIQVTIEGGSNEPPPQEGDCREEGDGCIPGVTPLCDEVTTYCECSGINCIVLQQGSINRQCIHNNDNDSYSCNFGTPSSQDENCICAASSYSWEGLCFNTAIGCIPFLSILEMARFFVGYGIGLAGGIALVLIVIAGFIIMTSSGDPKKLDSGRQLLITAISGLLMVILSIFLLRIIGVDVLRLL